MTTPGATKFYRSDGRVAEQCQSFTIKEASTLEFLPQETIYFPNCIAKMNTTIHLESGSVFCGWDIHCLGLPMNNKGIESGKVRVSLDFFMDGRLLLSESINITEEKEKYSLAFLQSQPVFGTFLCSGADETLLETVRVHTTKAKKGLWGATLIESLLIVRYMGESTNEAKAIFLAVWKHCRSYTLNREPELPRIWAT